MKYLDLAQFKPRGSEFSEQSGETLMAMTLWGEARGEGLEGMQSVANVIINRCSKPLGHWWYYKNYMKNPLPDRVKSVVLKQYQFSIYNPGDPNRSKILTPWRHDSTRIWESAQLVAIGAMDGMLEDVTNGSDHYHSYPRSRLDLWPSWAKVGDEPKTERARVGVFRFYQLEP